MKLHAIISQTRTVDVSEAEILSAAAQLVEQDAKIDGLYLGDDLVLYYAPPNGGASSANGGYATSEQIIAFRVSKHLRDVANKESN